MTDTRFSKILALFSVLLWLATGRVAAQPVGHPAGSHAPGKLTVTALAAYTRHSYQPFAYEAPLYLAKLALGVTKWFDLALLGGVTDLRATGIPEGMAWWSQGYKPAAGVGLWLDPLRLGPLATYVAATAVGYASTGARYREEIDSGERRVLWDATEQKIGEMLIATGLALEVHSARLYAGAGINRWWRRVETTSELHRGVQKTVLKHRVSTYDAEPVVCPLVGLQLDLPHRLFLSLEASGKTAEDFWIAVGFGQTGSPD